MTTSAIIVAGGQGTRMKSTQPKQYLQLGGMAVMSHALNVFGNHQEIDEIILVVPAADIPYCRSTILSPLKLQHPIRLTAGGSQRQESVGNGLRAVHAHSDIVIIHDAVRPFIDSEGIRDCLEGAKQYGACTLGIPVNDTMKKADADGLICQTIERENVWLIQTPQAFKTELLCNAHARAHRDRHLATDDCALVERLGLKVKIIPGKSTNIKVTTPHDLLIAGALLSTAVQNNSAGMDKTE